MKKATWYILFSAIALGTGGLAGWLTSDALRTVYPHLEKSPLNPPGVVFPIVWSVLYVLMGVGLARVVIRRRPGTAWAAFLWAVQLAMNFGWTLIFFREQAFLAALIWLAVLWAVILAMTLVFHRLDQAAGWLQIPYLAWVAFAGYLNYAVWVLNS